MNEKRNQDKKPEQVFYINGMHCANCELKVEKKLLELKHVKAVEASLSKEQILVEHDGKGLSTHQLNKLFKEDGYTFSDTPRKIKWGKQEIGTLIFAPVAVLFLLRLLENTGISSLVDVDSTSSLPTFLAFGFVAGLSSCAALIGGLVLSLSKQWNSYYQKETRFVRKIEPHLLFNLGRLISYAALGALLGILGKTFKLSTGFTTALILGVSVIMIILALGMLDIKIFQRVRFSLPKKLTRYVAGERHFQKKIMPFVLGGLTFFLPCGFTVAAQSMALLSGNPLQGALIMLVFALGTLPVLLAISFGSVTMLQRKNFSGMFLKIAGVVVLLFAFSNIKNQFTLLGIDFSSIWPSSGNKITLAQSTLPPIVDGKQVVRMKAASYGWDPAFITVKAGIPVRWEIEDAGFSGCTNAIVAPKLFEGRLDLARGKVTVYEFNVDKAGVYPFSCWMGMVPGTINVVASE